MRFLLPLLLTGACGCCAAPRCADPCEQVCIPQVCPPTYPAAIAYSPPGLYAGAGQSMPGLTFPTAPGSIGPRGSFPQYTVSSLTLGTSANTQFKPEEIRISNVI